MRVIATQAQTRTYDGTTASSTINDDEFWSDHVVDVGGVMTNTSMTSARITMATDEAAAADIVCNLTCNNETRCVAHHN